MRDVGKFRVDRNHTKIMNLLSEQTLSEMTQQSVSFGQEGLGYSNINNNKKKKQKGIRKWKRDTIRAKHVLLAN